MMPMPDEPAPAPLSEERLAEMERNAAACLTIDSAGSNIDRIGDWHFRSQRDVLDLLAENAHLHARVAALERIEQAVRPLWDVYRRARDAQGLQHYMYEEIGAALRGEEEDSG